MSDPKGYPLRNWPPFRGGDGVLIGAVSGLRSHRDSWGAFSQARSDHPSLNPHRYDLCSNTPLASTVSAAGRDLRLHSPLAAPRAQGRPALLFSSPDVTEPQEDKFPEVSQQPVSSRGGEPGLGRFHSDGEAWLVTFTDSRLRAGALGRGGVVGGSHS